MNWQRNWNVSRKRWVVNASPLITLASIAQVTLLERLCPDMVIPAAVAAEIRAGLPQDAARCWLESAGKQYIHPVDSLDPVVAAWDLGAGESEVLTWARRQPGSEAILDDRAARNCALTLHVPVRGTLGVVLLAKREGLIPMVQPIFQQLLDVGLRAAPEIVAAALELAGEK